LAEKKTRMITNVRAVTRWPSCAGARRCQRRSCSLRCACSTLTSPTRSARAAWIEQRPSAPLPSPAVGSVVRVLGSRSSASRSRRTTASDLLEYVIEMPCARAFSLLCDVVNPIRYDKVHPWFVSCCAVPPDVRHEQQAQRPTSRRTANSPITGYPSGVRPVWRKEIRAMPGLENLPRLSPGGPPVR
jgi:hypothetical protein